jgi:spore germination cell wall hydrolase CwlJ-like protein
MLLVDLCGVACVRKRQGSERFIGPRGHGVLPVLVLGLAAFAGLPAQSGRSDIPAYLSGINRDGAGAYLTTSPAGSIQKADMVFKDPIMTSGIASDAGLILPDGRKVAMKSDKKPDEGTPDEDRVTRGQKKDRIVSVFPVSPPKYFSAGSILDRTSFIFKPVSKASRDLAFLKPKIVGKEIQIAEVFYKKKPVQADNTVPVEIASLVNNKKADILATAYADATPDYARESPFDSILKKDDGSGRFVPQIGPNDHAWAADPLPPTVFSAKEQDCLSSAIYFESRGEIIKGQAAVAQVILNRVRNPAYPDTICGVVYQNEDWRNRCQFSFACDNIIDKIWNRDNWKTARDVAMAVTAGKIWMPEVGSATHYHATYVHPAWARTMKRVARIGQHIFYRTYGGGWS